MTSIYSNRKIPISFDLSLLQACFTHNNTYFLKPSWHLGKILEDWSLSAFKGNSLWQLPEDFTIDWPERISVVGCKERSWSKITMPYREQLSYLEIFEKISLPFSLHYSHSVTLGEVLISKWVGVIRRAHRRKSHSQFFIFILENHGARSINPLVKPPVLQEVRSEVRTISVPLIPSLKAKPLSQYEPIVVYKLFVRRRIGEL